MMHRRLLITAASVLAVLLVGSFAAWHWAEGRMADGFRSPRLCRRIC